MRGEAVIWEDCARAVQSYKLNGQKRFERKEGSVGAQVGSLSGHGFGNHYL